MSAENNGTFTLIDRDSGDEALVIVRVTEIGIAIGISKLSDGDIEVIVSPQEAQLIATRLAQAASSIRGIPDTQR